MLQPDTSKKTYRDMANMFMKYIMSQSKGIQKVNVVFDIYMPNSIKVSKGAKIWNRYNQVPHLTQDTNGKVTNSQ